MHIIVQPFRAWNIFFTFPWLWIWILPNCTPPHYHTHTHTHTHTPIYLPCNPSHATPSENANIADYKQIVSPPNSTSHSWADKHFPAWAICWEIERKTSLGRMDSVSVGTVLGQASRAQAWQLGWSPSPSSLWTTVEARVEEGHSGEPLAEVEPRMTSYLSPRLTWGISRLQKAMELKYWGTLPHQEGPLILEWAQHIPPLKTFHHWIKSTA